MTHEMTKKTGLTLVEVIALRLYTGPAFQHYNQHLRGLSEATQGGGAQGVEARRVVEGDSGEEGAAVHDDDPRNRERSEGGRAGHPTAGGGGGVPGDVQGASAGCISEAGRVWMPRRGGAWLHVDVDEQGAGADIHRHEQVHVRPLLTTTLPVSR